MRSTGMMNTQLNDNERYRSAHCFCLGLLLLVALAAIFASPLWAANEGPNIPISIENGSAEPPVLLADDQQNPSIVALPDKNRWFVVWEDWRNWDISGTDIYGRFINGDGTLCGDEIAISTAPGNQTVPVLAYRNAVSSSDNMMIAWQDSRGSATSGYIYYKILGISSLASNCTSGVLLGSEKVVGYKSIDGDHLLSRKLPKVAYDKARDQFWMVWVESRDQLQRLVEYPFGYHGSPKWYFADSNYVSFSTASAVGGTVATPEILRNTDGSSSRTVRLLSATSEFDEKGGTATYNYEYFTDINNVTVACDDSSPETLIVWEGVRGKATLKCDWEEKDEEENCYMVDDGEEGEEEVCVPNPDYGVPTAGDAYSSELTTEFDSDGMTHIYSIFDKYITQPVVHTKLVDSSNVPSYYPALGYDSIHRKFLVAWEDRGTGGDGIHSNINGQLIYSGGGLYGSNFAISYQDLDGDGALDDDIKYSNQTRPDIGIDSTNQRFFVSWQDARNSSVSLEKLDIYGQYVDSQGGLQGYNFGVCLEEANQYNPVTAYNQANYKFLTVWKDARNLNTSNSDIYGQCFSSGQPQLILLAADGTHLIPSKIDFSSMEVQQTDIVSITMMNAGSSTITIDAVTPLATPFFYRDPPVALVSADDGLTMDLLPGSSYDLTIQFAPQIVGVFFDKFTIISDSTDVSVNLQGQGTGKDIYVAPAILDFSYCEIDTSTVLSVVITNISDGDVQVNSAVTGTDAYSVSGITAGEVILAGGALTCQVTFKPTTAGYFEDGLYINIGPLQGIPTPFEEINLGTSYKVLLRGTANADFAYTDVDSYTADRDYKLSISASTSQSGQLYIIFSHDPLSSGDIFVLANDGTLQPFPYQTSSGWQNFWHLDSAYPGLEVDLSQVDFRPLGCSSCQGESVDDGGDDFYFGNILITPTNDEVFNNASDFKYMGGTLYMASYLKNASSSGVFDFNQGLLEMQSFNIHSLAGTWQVTSRYYDVDMVHAGLLVVTEPGNGQISAVWPPYNQTMVYSNEESAYVMTFNMGVYAYTYKITALTEDSFAGSYTCIASGVIIADNEPVSGVRIK